MDKACCLEHSLSSSSQFTKCQKSDGVLYENSEVCDIDLWTHVSEMIESI